VFFTVRSTSKKTTGGKKERGTGQENTPTRKKKTQKEGVSNLGVPAQSAKGNCLKPHDHSTGQLAPGHRGRAIPSELKNPGGGRKKKTRCFFQRPGKAHVWWGGKGGKNHVQPGGNKPTARVWERRSVVRRGSGQRGGASINKPAHPGGMGLGGFAFGTGYARAIKESPSMGILCKKSNPAQKKRTSPEPNQPLGRTNEKTIGIPWGEENKGQF